MTGEACCGCDGLWGSVSMKMSDEDPLGSSLPPSSALADTTLVVVSQSILFHLNTLRERCFQRDLIEPTFYLKITF